MGLKRVTGNSKKTQHLEDVKIASAIKASNQSNPRSGGTSLVSTPTTTIDGQVPCQDTTTKTTPTTKETSKQLMLTPYQNTTSSVRDFLAKAFQLLDKEGDLPIYGEHYSTRYAESLGLKDLRIFGLKTLKDYFLLHIQKLSKSGVKKISMKMENPQEKPLENTKVHLELKDGFFSQYSTRFGNLGMTVNGKCLTVRIGEYHKTGNECSLLDILEDSVDPKYFLSEKFLKGLMKGNMKPQMLGLYKRVYSTEGISAQLTAQGGGWGAKTGLYQVNPSKESGGKQPYQQNRVYSPNGLSPAINSQLSDMYKVEIIPIAIRAYPRTGSHDKDRKQRVETKKDGVANTVSNVQKDSMVVIHNLQPRSGNPHEGGTGHLQREDNIAYNLDTNAKQAIENNSCIRRLTPIECERLQGFPDNWTKYGLTKDGKVIEISDTQRYKMCGNAVTTNVITAIGKQFIESLVSTTKSKEEAGHAQDKTNSNNSTTK